MNLQGKQQKIQKKSDTGKVGRELFGMVCLFCGILFTLSLATFDSRDPWLNHVIRNVPKIHNLVGLFGAYLGGLLLDCLGIAAWMLPVFFFLAGARRTLDSPPWPWWRWLGFALLGVSIAIAGASRDITLLEVAKNLSSGGNVSTHGGGLLGHFLYSTFVSWLNGAGAFILWLMLFLLSIQMLIGFSWFVVLAGTAMALWKTTETLAGSVQEKFPISSRLKASAGEQSAAPASLQLREDEPTRTTASRRLPENVSSRSAASEATQEPDTPTSEKLSFRSAVSESPLAQRVLKFISRDDIYRTSEHPPLELAQTEEPSPFAATEQPLATRPSHTDRNTAGLDSLPYAPLERSAAQGTPSAEAGLRTLPDALPLTNEKFSTTSESPFIEGNPRVLPDERPMRTEPRAAASERLDGFLSPLRSLDAEKNFQKKQRNAELEDDKDFPWHAFDEKEAEVPIVAGGHPSAQAISTLVRETAPTTLRGALSSPGVEPNAIGHGLQLPAPYGESIVTSLRAESAMSAPVVKTECPLPATAIASPAGMFAPATPGMPAAPVSKIPAPTAQEMPATAIASPAGMFAPATPGMPAAPISKMPAPATPGMPAPATQEMPAPAAPSAASLSAAAAALGMPLAPPSAESFAEAATALGIAVESVAAATAPPAAPRVFTAQGIPTSPSPATELSGTPLMTQRVSAPSAPIPPPAPGMSRPILSSSVTFLPAPPASHTPVASTGVSAPSEVVMPHSAPKSISGVFAPAPNTAGVTDTPTGHETFAASAVSTATQRSFTAPAASTEVHGASAAAFSPKITISTAVPDFISRAQPLSVERRDVEGGATGATFSPPVGGNISAAMHTPAAMYTPAETRPLVEMHTPIETPPPFISTTVVRRPSPLPSLDLIDPIPPIANNASRALLESKGVTLMTCLGNFGIQGELVGITPGPVVTMFEIRPAPGVRVSRIANLSDDLALALKAVAVRIQAPVPGTDTVGIEIPNEVRETVCLRELLASSAFQNSASLLTLALGKDIAGIPAVADLAGMPHMLVAGATGAGKSVGINSIILSLLYKARPDEVKLLLVDPKRVEMAIYADLPHLVHPVVTEMAMAKNALEWAVSEMERRYCDIARAGVRNILDYNAKLKAQGAQREDALLGLEVFPYLVIIIDELADLMLVGAKEVETSIVRLAQLARAAGIHLILATQRPSVDVVTGLIKANFPCRISFQVSSKHDSRTILDAVGAEHLLGRGDMLFKPGGGKFQRMHGAFVSDATVSTVVNYWKSQQKPDYRLDFSEWGASQESDSAGFGHNTDVSADPMYAEAVEFVQGQGKASISLIQRRFRIGFNKAARLVEQMEQDGLIGPADGSKPRVVVR